MRAIIGMLVLLSASLYAELRCGIPETISRGLQANVSPAVDVNERGEAIAKWISYNGQQHTVAVALCVGESGWSEPDIIPDSCLGKLGVTLARIDDQGTGYVMWHSRFFPKSLLYFSKKDPGDVWSNPVSILTEEDRLKQPFFAFNSKFQPFILTQYEKDHWEESWAIRYQPGEKMTRRLARLNSIKSLVFNKQGSGFATWTFCQERSAEKFSTCFENVLQAVWTQEGERFYPYVTICQLALDYKHAKYFAAVNNQEGGALTWCSWKESDYRIFATSGTKKKWAEPLLIAQLSTLPVELQIAIDDQDNMVAAWIEESQLRVAYKDCSESWGVPMTLSNPNKLCQAFKLGTNEAGRFILAWDEECKCGEIVVHGADFALEKWNKTQLSATGQKCWAPVFAFNSKGEGVIAWMTFLEGDSHIQVANWSVK